MGDRGSPLYLAACPWPPSHRRPASLSTSKERHGHGEETQHPHSLGRRHRHLEHQPLQPRHDGLPDAQHRSRRGGGRDLHRLLLAAELHRRPRLLHHRPEPDPHRPHQGRHAGRHGRPAEGRPDHRRNAQAARLRHRPVRQEPPGRPRRIPADRARLRRVLRQSLSPERRGRTRAARLSEGPGVQESSSVRAACCTARPTARADRRSRTPAR